MTPLEDPGMYDMFGTLSDGLHFRVREELPTRRETPGESSASKGFFPVSPDVRGLEEFERKKM